MARAPPFPAVQGDSSAPARRSSSQPPAQRIFLTFYNLASAVLWAVILERVVLVYFYQGPWKVYFNVGTWVSVTQTLAVSEVVFSLAGTLVFYFGLLEGSGIAERAQEQDARMCLVDGRYCNS